MRFVTYRHENDARVGVLRGDRLVEVRALVPDAPPDLVGVIGDWRALESRVAAASERAPADAGRPLGGLELLPPIPRPGKIVCLGLNYVEHAAEGGH